ncbi:MAG: Fe-S oxidoreductase [Bacteroidetes bacterium]|nr:Fe-S oxidoreductase [Bacteroidota bacterium]
MPKVILIQPTQYGSKTGEPCKQSRIFLPGLVFPLLASYAPENWEVKVYIEVVDTIDFDEECDIVGIGAMGHAVFRAIDIAKEFRKRGKKVFMGGYMVSIMPDFVKEHCDSLVIGDGEISFPLLLRDFESTGELKDVYDNQLESLENIPLPKYEILTQKKIGYMLPVQAGRGCPHLCSYCSIACLYKGKYLFRPVDDVIRDIKRIKELGFKRFILIDDNIASNPDYLSELADKIKPLKMQWASQCSILIAKNEPLLKKIAASGCSMLSIGLESLSQEGLNSLRKGWVRTNEMTTLIKRIQHQGIAIASEMIIGTDGDTQESIKATADFIIKNKIPAPKFYILTPLPGTDFYKEMKSKDRLLHEDFSQYTAASCVFKPMNFQPKQLESSYFNLYKRVYSYRNIIYRTLLNMGLFKNPLAYLFAFFGNLVYKKSIRHGDAPNIL